MAERCATCGYDLSGLPKIAGATRCPECAAPNRGQPEPVEQLGRGSIATLLLAPAPLVTGLTIAALFLLRDINFGIIVVGSLAGLILSGTIGVLLINSPSAQRHRGLVMWLMPAAVMIAAILPGIAVFVVLFALMSGIRC